MILGMSAKSALAHPDDDDEKAGNHPGIKDLGHRTYKNLRVVAKQEKFLEYEIVYKDYEGILTINETGSHYYFPGWGYTVNSSYDEEFYGEYSVYLIGQTMHYEVHIRNTGHRTYKNLRVVAMQEYHETMTDVDYTGPFSITQGDPLPGDSTQEWVVGELRAGEEIVLDGSYLSPRGIHPGLDQTHLQIWHYKSCNATSDEGINAPGRLIIDDSTAGVYCPPEIFAESSNTTKADVRESESDDDEVNMQEQLENNLMSLPAGWTAGALVFVAAAAVVMTVILIRHKQSNVVGLSTRKK